MHDGQIVTAGGRVLAVTAWANDTASAVKQAYQAVDQIGFTGAYCRRDIAHKAL
jgi:phosphoribosylamine--glycine ligase